MGTGKKGAWLNERIFFSEAIFAFVHRREHGACSSRVYLPQHGHGIFVGGGALPRRVFVTLNVRSGRVDVR